MIVTPTLFFDVGGVLLTNGWDTPARTRAANQFQLDYPEFQKRHEMLKHAFETGRIDIDEYLRKSVFYQPRNFSIDEFKQFMFAQSQVLGDTLGWVRRLAATGKYRLFALNNESRALQEYRVATFGLHEVFSALFASCYLGQVKPDEEIYANALGMAACRREDAIFVDDRALNIEPAAILGLHAIHFQGLDDLKQRLATFGVEA